MSKNKKTISQSNNFTEKEKKQELTSFDYSALFFLTAFLVIDFLPTFGSVDIAGTQYLYLAILNMTIGIYIFKNPNLVTEKLVGFLKKSYFVKVYALFLILCLITIFTARNFSLSIISYSQLLISGISCLNLVILFSNRLHLLYKIAFIVGVFVFIESLLAFNQLMLSLKVGITDTIIQKINGNTGNINIFAATLAIKLPFVFLGILHYSNWKKWLLVVASFLSVSIIIVVYARSSYISILVNCLLFIAFILFIKAQEYKTSSLLPILFPVIFAVGIGSWILNSANSSDENADINSTVIKNNPIIFDANANARLLFWKNAGLIIKQNPIIGVGLGNWKIESIAFEKEILNNAIVSQHPHNDFLEIMAETGILNGLVYFSLFIILLLINLKKIVNSDDTTSKTVAFIALLVLLDYCIDSFLNFPLYRASMQIMLGLGIVLTLINSSENTTTTPSDGGKRIILVTLIIGLFTFYFSLTNFKSLCLENKIKADAELPEEQRILTSEDVVNHLPKFPNVCTSTEPFCLHAAIYNVKEKNYKTAEKYLKEAEKINPNIGISQWYQYRICKEKNQMDSAYAYVKSAYKLRPRNKDFFTSLLVMASTYKDTTEIFRAHKLFTSYQPMPASWINSSSALAISNYPIIKNIKFIEEGLKLFPNDKMLLERKLSFNNDFKSVNSTNSVNSNSAISSKNSPENLLQLAQKENINSNFNKAAQYYQEYLTYDSNNLNAKLNAGVCLIKASKHLKAISYLTDVYNTKKVKDGSIEYFLAVCYSNTNQHEKGCEFLKLAKFKKYPIPASTFEASCK
jgi:O-antigen ligase/tetratricopeptide (TPR) repeat protein